MPDDFFTDFRNVTKIGSNKATHSLEMSTIFIWQYFDIEFFFEIVNIKKSINIPRMFISLNDLKGHYFPIMNYALSRGVTMRDDSILVQPEPRCWYHNEMAQYFWPIMPVILEHEHYGGSVQRKAWDKSLLLKAVEEYHASYLSVHWWPDILLRENKDVIEKINLRLGYRIQVPHIEWPKKVSKNQPFIIKSSWKNSGVAPCYPGGYPCFTLKDSKGGIVSVLVDDSFNVRNLSVDAPGQAQDKLLESECVIAKEVGLQLGEAGSEEFRFVHLRRNRPDRTGQWSKTGRRTSESAFTL